MWGADGQFDRVEIVDVALKGLPEEAALVAIEMSAAGCGTDFAAKCLSELRALTAHRARDGEDLELIAVAYAGRLAAYPADVAKAACDYLADCRGFWPSWSELKAELDKRMSGRLKLRHALQNALATA